MLVVSEFIGCSPSLSGAIRINLWNVESTSEALNEVITTSEAVKHMRHEKHYRRRCWGIGLGFGFRIVELDPNFRKLSIDTIVSAYERAKQSYLVGL
ncbi:Trehalose-6-phosphate synthase [Thalictrum thalictroides]|uniref:Trehalose-6-phosphate synthase n=1 Tax=Thalictrum thalictroides TaxID=46969 RepID=A0A7J6VU01_THATH|nr:Trehalose-6-phosphate synthase [Thalictrum thalictroides]